MQSRNHNGHQRMHFCSEAAYPAFGMHGEWLVQLLCHSFSPHISYSIVVRQQLSVAEVWKGMSHVNSLSDDDVFPERSLVGAVVSIAAAAVVVVVVVIFTTTTTTTTRDSSSESSGSSFHDG